MMPVGYTISGTEYKGTLYYDETFDGARPMVMIFPDWDGVTEYELWQGKQLAHLGLHCCRS